MNTPQRLGRLAALLDLLPASFRALDLDVRYAVLKLNGFNWRWQQQGLEYTPFWPRLVCWRSRLTVGLTISD